MSLQLGNFFKGLVALAESDLAKILGPDLVAATQSVASNPTKLNAVAQGTKLLVAAIAAGPKIGQDELQALAAEVGSVVTEWETSTASKAANLGGATPPGTQAQVTGIK